VLSCLIRRYEFSTATSAIYSFWQYELCDVFIELVKPVMSSPGLRMLCFVRALKESNANWLRICRCIACCEAGHAGRAVHCA